MKVSHVGVSCIYFPEVFYAVRNEITVSLLIYRRGTVDGHFDFSLKNDAPLRFVAMLRQLHILRKMHKDNLMVAALGQIGRNAFQGDIRLGKVQYRFRKYWFHCFLLANMNFGSIIA